MNDRENDLKKKENDEKLQGSASDPQKTEMEGLKQGGVEPNVYPDDKAKDEKGKTDDR